MHGFKHVFDPVPDHCAFLMRFGRKMLHTHTHKDDVIQLPPVCSGSLHEIDKRGTDAYEHTHTPMTQMTRRHTKFSTRAQPQITNIPTSVF